MGKGQKIRVGLWAGGGVWTFVFILAFAVLNVSALAEGGGTPVIVTQPVDMRIAQDEAASFHVEATGDGLTYQWQATDPTSGTVGWNGVLLWVDVEDDYGASGMNTATLTLSAAEASSSWYNVGFRCVVTSAAGSVTSESAELTVIGGWPIIDTIRGLPVSNQSIGLGMEIAYPLTAAVTVPNEVASLTLADIVVLHRAGEENIISLHTNETYADPPVDSVNLAVGVNNVYIRCDMGSEGRVYYRVTVTREGPPGGAATPPPSATPPPAAPTETADTTAPREPRDAAAPVPRTGDETRAGLWLALLAVTGVALSVFVALYRKNRAR